MVEAGLVVLVVLVALAVQYVLAYTGIGEAYRQERVGRITPREMAPSVVREDIC